MVIMVLSSNGQELLGQWQRGMAREENMRNFELGVKLFFSLVPCGRF
jgi:hypothetical protein